MYLPLSMFYLTKSGLPQISDWILLIIIGIHINIILRTVKKSGYLGIIFITLISVIVITNTLNCVLEFDKRFIFSSFYYIYNFLAFYLFYYYFKHSRNTNLLRYGISISVIIQVLFLTYFATQTYRLEGTYNNPNQLGFWGLLILMLFLSSFKKKDRFEFVNIFILQFFFTFKS